MTPTVSTIRALRMALVEIWAFRWPLLATHITVSLLTLAVVAPLIGLTLNLGITFSNKAALTDQEIAWFLLSPAGLLCFLVIASILLVGLVLEVAIMTGVLSAGGQSVMPALKRSLARFGGRLPAIVSLAVQILVRILLIALPFVGLAAAIALAMLGEYDINYYLATRPPEFLVAAALIGLVLLAGVVILTARIATWALAIHLILLRGRPHGRALTESAAAMQGSKLTFLRQMALCLGLRLVIGAAAATLFGVAATLVLPLVGADLRVAAAVVVTLLGAAALIDAVISTMITGLVSSMLLQLYRKAFPSESIREATAPPAGRSMPGMAAIAISGVVAIGAGLATAWLVLDRITTEDRTSIIAHRGAAAVRPENSMAAFEKAIEDRADWVELDVQETADGEVVVLHDRDFMKLAGVGLQIRDATIADLATIDIGSWFDPTYRDERVPTLHAALDAMAGRTDVLIELKYYGTGGDLEARTVEVVRQLGVAEDVAIMSLNFDAIAKVREIAPELRVGLLAARAIGDLSALDADFVAVNTGMVSRRLLERAQANGKDVYVWTVNDPMLMSRLISMGVDGLITDDPALAREVLEYRRSLSTPERLALWLGDVADMVPDQARLMRDASP